MIFIKAEKFFINAQKIADFFIDESVKGGFIVSAYVVGEDESYTLGRFETRDDANSSLNILVKLLATDIGGVYDLMNLPELSEPVPKFYKEEQDFDYDDFYARAEGSNV